MYYYVFVIIKHIYFMKLINTNLNASRTILIYYYYIIINNSILLYYN